MNREFPVAFSVTLICYPNREHVNTNYDMTVWILAGNNVSFTIAAGLIRLHMPGVKKSRVWLGRARVTILSMVITSTVYWKFRQSLVSQATLQPLIMCADSLLICFIAVEIVKTNLNSPIWKAWGSASRAQRPLPTGIVRRQFPSLRGTTWRNKGRSAWNGSRFEHICAFYVEITNIQGVKLKMSCYNRD